MIPTLPPSNGRPPLWPVDGPPVLPPPTSGLDRFTEGSAPPVPPAPGPAPSPSRRTRRAALVGGLVGALIAGAGVGGVMAVTRPDAAPSTTAVASPSAPVTAAAGTPLELHALIDKVEPSVVAIEVSAPDDSGSLQSVAAGSGVVISADGLVLTNAHVVNVTDLFGRTIPNPVFTLKLHDGTVREAKVLGTAPDADVALLRITDAAHLTPIELGRSAEVRVGDEVVAIGNALDLGDSPTVTKGIVSALDRTLAESDTVTLHHLIQTDAPINHGNSGGALVDAEGRLIGINSAGIPDAQNIGFAIPVDTITPLLDDLEAGKTVTASPTAFLGVTVTQTPQGVSITSVEPGGAAAAAGLRAGDLLRSVAGTDIATIEQLGTTLQGLRPGTTAPVTVQRDGAPTTVTVHLGARPG